MSKWKHEDIREVWAIAMANARCIIKKKRITSNGRLMRDLFGTGMGTALERCKAIGLNPDDNNTSLNAMFEHIKATKGE